MTNHRTESLCKCINITLIRILTEINPALKKKKKNESKHHIYTYKWSLNTLTTMIIKMKKLKKCFSLAILNTYCQEKIKINTRIVLLVYR